MWVYGHHSTLKNAEADYAVAVAKHNAEAKAVQESNAKIMDALREAEASRKETARIEADAAYQYRKASERGVRIERKAGGITANIELAKVEMAKPPDPPADSSTAYLTRWDSWIRLANFGELALAIFTLIFIRVRSSLTNSPREEDFPAEIDVEKRVPLKRENLARKKKLERSNDSFDSARYAAGAKALRDALKDISFRLKGRSFKVTVKPDSVWIMMVEANQGTQQSVASARCNLTILRDAETMPRDKFRAKLERTLQRGGFEI
jgi:hypothetical protein